MSTSLTKLLPPTTASQPSSQLLTPSTQPVPLLSEPISKIFSQLYTASIVLYYYLRAGDLVTDPLPTLITDLLPLAASQAIFCALCLPAAGGWYSGTGDAGLGGNSTPSKGAKSASVSTAGSARKRVGVKGTGSSRAVGDGTGASVYGGPVQSRVLSVVFSLLLTVTVPPVPLGVLALVLGAPLYPTSLLPHTFVLAMHVSFLGFLPLFYSHGVSALAWRDVAAAWLPFDEAGVWAGTIGCMVGGWIGAVPMALDWDREWQKWPCTVIWGVVMGWAIGRTLTTVLRLGIGKRINFSEKGTQSARNTEVGGRSISTPKKLK